MRFVIAFLLLLIPVSALAQSEIDALRHQLEKQRVLTREQAELLKAQQQRIDSMNKRLEEMEKSVASDTLPSGEKARKTSGRVKMESAQTTDRFIRDGIGDLNQSAVQKGEFPGSIKLPGTGNVSLALGGFIKTVAIIDSNAETQGADFLPAYLNSSTNDDGNTSIDATLTRLFLEGRAPVPNGHVRGYVEGDFNGKNDGNLELRMRLAYGEWDSSYGTLLAGQTWSTMMDLKILPEGLTEPTLSGAIFVRQAQIRWSQPLSSGFLLHAAIEDPSSNDVFSGVPTQNTTAIPDVVLGLEYNHAKTWHVRLNGIVRKIKVDLPAGGDTSATAWGTSFTGYINIFDRDKLAFGAVYGEGLGRYLLGIQSTSGAAIDPVSNELDLRDNWGGFVTYKHQWTDTLRSTAALGYARSEPLDWQTGDTFESSIYGSCNLMWSLQPYLTMGFEYQYGKRKNVDDSNLDNHRLAFGIQIF